MCFPCPSSFLFPKTIWCLNKNWFYLVNIFFFIFNMWASWKPFYLTLRILNSTVWGFFSGSAENLEEIHSEGGLSAICLIQILLLLLKCLVLRAVKSHLIEIDGPQVQSKRSTYILICCCLLHSISFSLNLLNRSTVTAGYRNRSGIEQKATLFSASHLDWRIHVLNLCTAADALVERLGVGRYMQEPRNCSEL